jgi:ribosomal protein S12 methylthiotransferase
MRKPFKFYVENLGCAKNQVDSETIITLLGNEGCAWVTDPAEADLIIVNSCGFIEKAKEESVNTTLLLRERHPGKKILLAGCLVERYEDQLRKELSEIDGFSGNRTLESVRDAALSLMGMGRPSSGHEKQVRTAFLSFPGSVYVKIAEGCDNGCAYCSIPLIRGGLVSRTVKEIVEEIRTLHDRGIFEFNLVAQDLGSFGRDRGRVEIADLFAALSRLDGRFWIRPLYIHPDHFPFELLPVIRGDGRFLPYFDIPFQHASRSVLSRMGRKGSKERYLDLIARIRDEAPGAVMRSTFLTGFPGETDGDFGELADFQQKAGLNWLGVFEYSREEDTAAYGMKGTVPRGTARKRREILEKNQVPITERGLDAMIGLEAEVLVEEEVKGEALFLGRCRSQAPDVDGLTVVNARGLVPGSLVNTRITRRNGFDLEAVVIPSPR